MTWLGKRSYSIYLTHWPIIVLYQRLDPTALNGQKWLILFAVSILSGWALYAFVESKFRYAVHKTENSGPPAKTKFALGIGTVFLAMSITYAHGYASGGWVWRYNDDPMSRYARMTLEKVNVARVDAIVQTCPGYSFTDITIAGKCYDRAAKADVIIMGNSHAEDMLNIWADMFPEDTIAFLGGAGCPPVYPVQEFGSKDCPDINQRRFEAIDSLPKDWNGLFVFGSKTDKRNIKGHKAAIRHIDQLGHKILIIGNTPVFKEEVHAQVMKAGDLELAERTLNEKYALTLGTDGNLRKFAKTHGYGFVSKRKALCPRADYCRVHHDRKLFYFDSNHLTGDGTDYLAEKLKPAILEARKQLGR